MPALLSTGNVRCIRKERRPRRSAKRCQNQPYNPSVTASPCHRLAFRLGRRFCGKPQRCPLDTRVLPCRVGRRFCLRQRCPLDTRVLPCRVGRRFCLRQRCPPDTRALAGEAKTPPACLAATHLPLQGRQKPLRLALRQPTSPCRGGKWRFCRLKNKRVARSAIRLFCCMGL